MPQSRPERGPLDIALTADAQYRHAEKALDRAKRHRREGLKRLTSEEFREYTVVMIKRDRDEDERANAIVEKVKAQREA